ncbi:MAG: hypothetical protein KDE51_22875 [Anaerolineales bacterium]|nr:hypothetical protein [Anaerolineales bacterium]
MTTPQSSDAIQQKVEQGIQALRAGEREKGRQLLTEVITADDQNEKAWLWLSSAVDSDEERKLCLENVLTINPQNHAAQKSLAKLQQKVTSQEPLPTVQKIDIVYQDYSKIDDIWARAEALQLCPYCAAELKAEQKRCHQCKQNLTVTYYQHAKPKPNFHIYWVLILGLSQLFMLQVIIDSLTEQPLEIMILHGLMSPVFLVLTVLLFMRRNWAHIISVVILFLAALLVIATPFLESAVSDIFLGTTLERTPLFGLAQGFSSAITGAIRILQLAGIALAAYFGIFIVPPDFARETVLLRAEVNRKANKASGLFLAGDRYAKRKMWAAAVLNWQRAAALDPTRLLYQLSLAQAYAELNYFDRSLDVLQSARNVVATPEAQAKIKEVEIDVQARMKQQQTK